jgi:hypothetical protein
MDELDSRSAAIYISPVIDIHDEYGATFVVDAVADAIFATARAPQALKRSLQGRADSTGIRA